MALISKAKVEKNLGPMETTKVRSCTMGVRTDEANDTQFHSQLVFVLLFFSFFSLVSQYYHHSIISFRRIGHMAVMLICFNCILLLSSPLWLHGPCAQGTEAELSLNLLLLHSCCNPLGKL